MTEQIKLTNALIEAYIAAAPDLDMMVDKVARKIQRSKELSPELVRKHLKKFYAMV